VGTMLVAPCCLVKKAARVQCASVGWLGCSEGTRRKELFSHQAYWYCSGIIKAVPALCAINDPSSPVAADTSHDQL
jgi:hypothetical protein